MSEENVDLVCRRWEAQMKRDPRKLDFSMLDPEVVYEDDFVPDHAGETYHGHDGLRRAWARAIEPWESFTNEIEWARDAGDEVVTGHLMRVKAKESGIAAELRYAYVWSLRDGKVVYCKSFANPADALEAAGLSE